MDNDGNNAQVPADEDGDDDVDDDQPKAWSVFTSDVYRQHRSFCGWSVVKQLKLACVGNITEEESVSSLVDTFVVIEGGSIRVFMCIYFCVSVFLCACTFVCVYTYFYKSVLPRIDDQL